MAAGRRWIALLIACIALSGCTTSELALKRKTEIEAKVENMMQVTQRVELRTNEFSDRLMSQDDRFKGYTAQIKQLEDAVRELRNAQDELKARQILLSQQITPPKIEVINQEPTAKVKDGGPSAEYIKAFGLYSSNNFQESITAFEAFLKDNPQSEYAANALYWIGECHYSLSDLATAKEIFLKVAGNYPNSPKAPDALLKLGYCLAALKDKTKANSVFESLIKSYPGSPAALKARERLTAS